MKPILSPATLLTLNQKAEMHAYWIKLGWDGQQRLLAVEDKKQGRQPCLLLLDPALPFRRRLQRYPAQIATRQALLKSAPAEFPLDPAEHYYAITPNPLSPGEGYLLALPKATLQPVYDAGYRPLSIHVIAEGSSLEANQSSLEKLSQQPRDAEFLRQHYLISRPRLQMGGLVFLVLLGLVLIAAVLHPLGPLAGLAQRQLVALQRSNGPLAAQYQTLQTMAQQQQSLQRLQAQPQARLGPRLQALLATLPAGYAINAIDYKEGSLSLKGQGAGKTEPLTAWLKQNNVSPESASLQTGGDLTIFSIEIKP